MVPKAKQDGTRKDKSSKKILISDWQPKYVKEPTKTLKRFKCENSWGHKHQSLEGKSQKKLRPIRYIETEITGRGSVDCSTRKQPSGGENTGFGAQGVLPLRSQARAFYRRGKKGR